MPEIKLEVKSYEKNDSYKSIYVHNHKGDLFDGRVKISKHGDSIIIERVGLNDRDSRKLTKAGNRYYTSITWVDAEVGLYEYDEEESNPDKAVFYFVAE